MKLNSGAEKSEITVQSPGHSGNQALQLRTIGKAGFNSAVYSKDFDVTPGQQVTASVMMRGKGQGYIRIYFLDAAGKRMKKYQMSGKKTPPTSGCPSSPDSPYPMGWQK